VRRGIAVDELVLEADQREKELDAVGVAREGISLQSDHDLRLLVGAGIFEPTDGPGWPAPLQDRSFQ
jgi:hypothetical protein